MTLTGSVPVFCLFRYGIRYSITVVYAVIQLLLVPGYLTAVTIEDVDSGVVVTGTGRQFPGTRGLAGTIDI
jgi:hypothetical protein